LRSRVVAAMAKVKNNGWVEVLQKCPTLKERYAKLAELLPEISGWDIPMARQQLFFHIHYVFGVDLGVCPYFLIDDYRQYCRHDGKKNECTCVIPQPFCIFRDQDGIPKYPDLIPLPLASAR
jgi:hypothetical protein